MQNNDFTITLQLKGSPLDVFNAVNNPRIWWSEEITGVTDKVGGIFEYHYGDAHYAKIQIAELIPGRKTVWHVLENRFNFTEDTTEWSDTYVHFDITEQNGTTQLQFVHKGLTPEFECYEACHEGWSFYLHRSLQPLIDTGKGQPNSGTDAKTKAEKNLSA